jgi:hypothetical protein
MKVTDIGYKIKMLHIVWHSKKLRVICIYLKSKMATTRGKSFNICPYGKMNSKKNIFGMTRLLIEHKRNMNNHWMVLDNVIIFIRPSRIMWLGMAGFCTINLFSSVYRIFTKLGHMIPLWKGKNPIYFGVIRSKVKVTIQHAHLPSAECFLPPK